MRTTPSFILPSVSQGGTAVEAMRRCIDDLRQWIVHDHLKLNDDKTEFLLSHQTATS